MDALGGSEPNATRSTPGRHVSVGAPHVGCHRGSETASGVNAGRLSPAELKLVSEWVDIGGQYFNDPFQAPLN